MKEIEPDQSSPNLIWTKYLIIILCLAVLARVAVALILGNSVEYLPAIADQISYHSLAIRLLEHHGFTFDANWWPATRAGEPTAHWSYLYTSYLVLVYKIFGYNPLAARLIQAVLSGFLMPWFAYRLARRVYQLPGGGAVANESTGASPSRVRFSRLGWLNQAWLQRQEVIPLLVAAWVAFYGYFIYYAGALMTETFYILGILWTLDCALRIGETFTTGDKPARRAILLWVMLGFAIGITALTRQVFLLFVPFLFLWLWWVGSRQVAEHGLRRYWNSLVHIFPGAFASILVIALFILPITAFNYRQFGQFVLLNTNAGYAFYWANHPIYGEQYSPLLTKGMPSYYQLLPKDKLWMNEAALGNELMRRGIGFVVADPLRYLRLSLDRIPAYFLFWPMADSSLLSNFTRVASFAVALPFILVGIALWGVDVPRRRARLVPGTLPLLFALVYTLIHILSWAGIRYRLPVDSVLLIFGARSLYELGRLILFRK